MKNGLLPYYERELLFLRKMASEFAQQYPERASALRLTRDGCDDPHVERILEGFALIAGRIQRKIDEEFPEVTQSLLDLLYPHLLRPLPSMTILQFEVDPELSKRSSGHPVPRGTIAYAASTQGVQCKFRTAYPVELWPLAVAAAGFSGASQIAAGMAGEDARYALRIELETRGSGKLASLALKRLRFRIGGDAQAAHWLYEVLFNNVTRILLCSTDAHGKRHSVALPSTSIQDVGFGRDEALLPYGETSFQGYRLLQEYFAYPQKFLFFDLDGFEQMAQLSERFEIVIFVDSDLQSDRAVLLESAVNADTFQLGCTPAINLFEHCAEPIRLSHARTEYPVIPTVHAPLGYEVYSIDRVSSLAPESEATKEYRPFYSFQHEQQHAPGEAFWIGIRRASQLSFTQKTGSGSDMYLSLVDRNFKASDPAAEVVTVHVTCTNRDLPSKLHLTGAWGELDLECGATVRTRVVYGPTETMQPAMRSSLQWRLISHLSLNHLSIVEGGVGALQEMLRLYDPASSHATTRQIEGIVALRSGRKMARLDSEYGFVFCQGVAIDAEMDEDSFAGGGAYLLASILEHFFALYCGVNSFTQLRVSTRQRKGVVWQWPIRSGEQAVA